MANKLSPTPEQEREIATTGDGRDITAPWVAELKEPLDQRLWGAVDWGPYERVRKDDQVKACMEQRIRAVVSCDWEVLPGDKEDPRSAAAAEAMTDALTDIGWDRVTEKMLWADFYGISAAECMWATRHGFWAWSSIKVRHARRFRYDKNDQLRLLTPTNQRGELLPDRKFWVVKSGGTNDDVTYGEGLADWLYWPVWFKRNGIRFWNIFLDKFAVPTVKATYPRGASTAEIAKALETVQAIATDTGFVLPEGFIVELLQQAKAGADFGEVVRYMDGAIAKIILGQTMTTDASAGGIGGTQANVHDGVKLQVVKACADLITDSFADGPARWFTDYNFGIDVAAPRVIRVVEEPQDLKAEAEKDKALAEMGWELDDEAFADRYGPGYRRAEKPAAAPAMVAPPIAANDPAQADRQASFAASDPRPLYVYRSVLNADEIIAWARSQGFASTLAPADMHVTLAYSRSPVNWFVMASAIPLGDKMVIDPGGPRIVEPLGSQGAVALIFASDQLAWRHRTMREAGASWDYPEYLPHVTLTYQGGNVDLAKVQPYRGRIVLGPEVFEALDEGAADNIAEVSLAEPAGTPANPRDVVDDATDALLAGDGWRPIVAPIVEPLLQQLRAASSLDEVRAILTREAELGDDRALAENLAQGGFAVRIDALTDDSQDG